MFPPFTGDGSNNVAVFVDGPNIIRSEFDLDLDSLREAAESLGDITIAKVFLNQYASDKLVEALISQGFDIEVGLAGENEDDNDVDVYMAVEAMEAVFDPDIDTIAVATRDGDFLPVLQKAKQHGKDTAIICLTEGLSTGLRNAADEVVVIGEAPT